jgi:chromosome partitioning protein
MFGFKFAPQVVALQIVKGGTGKTSLASSIAVRASLYGARVLCIDADQQGNLTQSFGVNADNYDVLIDFVNTPRPIEEIIVPVIPGIDLIPSRIDNATLDSAIIMRRHPLHKIFRDHTDRLKSQYDLIIIDCPPALGQAVSAWSLAADLVISPVDPAQFSISGLLLTDRELDNIEKDYSITISRKVIINKFDNRTQLSHKTLSFLMTHDTYSRNLFGVYIRACQEIPNAMAKQESIYDTLRINTAQEDIDAITCELLKINNISTRQDNKDATLTA